MSYPGSTVWGMDFDDQRGTTLENVDMTGSRFTRVDFTGSTFRAVALHGVVMRDVEVSRTTIDGEIEEFRGADIRPVDFDQMATLAYDISHYQPILFACDGMSELTDRVAGFFAEFDDDVAARLVPRNSA